MAKLANRNKKTKGKKLDPERTELKRGKKENA